MNKSLVQVLLDRPWGAKKMALRCYLKKGQEGHCTRIRQSLMLTSFPRCSPITQRCKTQFAEF